MIKSWTKKIRPISKIKWINKIKKGVLFINTPNARKALSEFSYATNNNKPNNLIAVTGTNGKSSIADFYYQILDLNNKKVASIGTLGVKSKNLKMNLLNTNLLLFLLLFLDW